MFHVSIYVNDAFDGPPSNQPLTSICTCTCIMDAQERREARLSRRRARERMNCALESAKEKHGWRGGE